MVPKSIEVHGRRWFRKNFGGTYHTAQIVVDGEVVHATPMLYGYGSQYLQTARDWLKREGYVPGIEEHPNGSGESLWRYCQRMGCEFLDTVEDVRRQKDLHRPVESKRRSPLRRASTPHGRCRFGHCVEHEADPTVAPCTDDLP